MALVPSSAEWFPPDSRLGPYRLVRPISAGGMSRVYEGRLDSLAGVSTRVALKLIHPDYAADPAFQELFIEEARVSARLEHQNLVRIQQFNREGDRYYLVMEYIDGITIRKLISLCHRYRVQLPVEVVAEIGRQAAEGLHYAHQLTGDHAEPLHLVHRDVKPSNLMLTALGTVKLLDFGISSPRAGAGDAACGTWGYMPIEQADGQGIGPGADVFALAAVLFELATAEMLIEEKDPERIRAHLLADDPARRAASLGGAVASLGPVLVRALQRDPAARFPSAGAFGRALADLIRDPPLVHEAVVSLYREFHHLESASHALARERVRSGATGTAPGLPVGVGDAYRPQSTGAVPPSAASTPLSPWVGVGLVVVVVAMVLGVWFWSLRPAPARQAAATEAGLVALPDAAGTGFLTISTSPRARLRLDGEDLSFTPAFRRPTSAGSHEVELVSDDGRTKRFTVEVRPGEETRRIWLFDEEAWGGP